MWFPWPSFPANDCRVFKSLRYSVARVSNVSDRKEHSSPSSRFFFLKNPEVHFSRDWKNRSRLETGNSPFVCVNAFYQMHTTSSIVCLFYFFHRIWLFFKMAPKQVRFENHLLLQIFKILAQSVRKSSACRWRERTKTSLVPDHPQMSVI